jgi:hypothetical protein
MEEEKGKKNEKSRMLSNDVDAANVTRDVLLQA